MMRRRREILISARTPTPSTTATLTRSAKRGFANAALAGPAVAGLLPLSFDMTNATEVRAFHRRKQQEPESRWLLRRAHSGDGKGTVIWDEAERRGDLAWLLKSPNMIASRYIADPLLLDGRKTELRVYVMVESTRPELRAHVYQKWFLAKVAAESHQHCAANSSASSSSTLANGLSDG